MKKNNRFTTNISLVIFGMIFLYLIASMVIYFTTDHITSYHVKLGTLSQNSTYTALVLRDETVVNAANGGYLTYYTPEGGRTAVNETVYAVNATPQGGQAASTNTGTEEAADEETLASLRTTAYDYAENYKASRFSTVYDLKYTLESNAMASNYIEGNGTEVKASSDGIVSYYTDGYEGKTADTISQDDFNYNNYRKQRLQTTEQVAANTPVYKLISGEEWSVVIPLSDGQLNRIADYEEITVKFEKDGREESGEVRTFDQEGYHYAEITFQRGLVRYSKERFLDIELITNTKYGLKVPKTAIVDKEFYMIPEDYSYETEDGSKGFLKETTDKKGNKTAVMVEDAIFDSIEMTVEESGTKETAASEETESLVDTEESNSSENETVESQSGGTESEDKDSAAGQSTDNGAVNAEISTENTGNTAETEAANAGDMTETTTDASNTSASSDTEQSTDTAVEDEEPETVKYYLVEKSYFDEGDVIILNGSESRYTIGESYSLKGVYNINKGYAIFQSVSIIDENEEYCIISNDEESDLKQYDYIVRDQKDVKEDQIIR